MKRQIEKQLKREISYISSFFPYDIKRFHNEDLIYMQAVLLTDPLSGRNSGSEPGSRLANLITGLELLSIGTTFHDFNRDGSNILQEKSPSGEKGYTLELLFGDIFYSRAVIYLLKFRDHKTFDSILEALKKLHESRLDLHLAIQKVLGPGGDAGSVGRDKKLLIDANRLLYISVITGLGLSGSSKMIENRKLLSAVDSLLMFKTYGDLLQYLISPGPLRSSTALSGCLKESREVAARRIKSLIAGLEDTSLRNGFNIMFESLGRHQSLSL